VESQVESPAVSPVASPVEKVIKKIIKEDKTSTIPLNKKPKKNNEFLDHSIDSSDMIPDIIHLSSDIEEDSDITTTMSIPSKKVSFKL